MAIYRIVSFSLIFFIFCSKLIVADEIYLKSGRKIEGVVLHKSDSEVVVEMAMGQVTLDRSKISKIILTESGNQTRSEFIAVAGFEEELSKLKRSLSSMFSKKGTVSLLSGKSKSMKKRLALLEDDLLEKRKESTEAMQALEPYSRYKNSGIPSSVYPHYYKLYTRYESLNLEVENLETQIQSYSEVFGEASAAALRAERQFLDDLAKLRIECEQMKKAGCPESALEFATRSLTEYESILSRQIIQLKRVGNSFYVPVTVNGLVTREFILDTGCSDLLINRGIEGFLKLNPGDYLGRSQSQIADGSIIGVKRIVLRSVSVGSFTVENVAASVPSDSENTETPLLLGMAFLKHFQFSIDASAKTLTLERMKE